MSTKHHIEWEIKITGSQRSGAGYNPTNPNAGLNYSYGEFAQTISINDLVLSYANNPYVPSTPIWTADSGGSIAAGTYFVGVRYVALDGNGNLAAYSELVESSQTISSGSRIVVTSPIDPGHPFDHYQVFLRSSSGSFTYAQKQNYGGGAISSPIGSNLTLNSFSIVFDNIAVSSLPNKGNVRLLSSATRNFIPNDIGNFIYLENNHTGIRNMSATNVSNSYFVELGKTDNEPYAAWFELDATRNLKQLSIVMWKQGSPSNDIYIEIRTNSGGVPSVPPAIVEFEAFNASTLSSSPQWIDLEINTNLSTGKYWVVIYTDASADNSNYVKIGKYDSNGFANSNNNTYVYNSSTLVWNNINDGYSLAMDAIWNSTSLWGEGDNSNLIINKGDLRLEILNVNLNQALIASDLYIADDGSTGGRGVLGSSCNNIYAINETNELQQFHGIAYVKNSTYLIGSVLELSNLSLSGYDIDRNDLGTNPILLADNTISPNPFSSTGMIDILGNDIQLINLEIDGNEFAEYLITCTDKRLIISHSWLHHAEDYGIYLGTGSNQRFWLENSRISNITGQSSDAAGVFSSAGNHLCISGCTFDNIEGAGINAFESSIALSFNIFHNIINSSTNYGHGIIARRCTDTTIYFNTFNGCEKSGIHFIDYGSAMIMNSLFTNNLDHGILIDMIDPLSFGFSKIVRNAFYNNAINNLEVNPPVIQMTDQIILPSNPYVHIGNDYVDLTLNTLTGSGDLLIAKAYPVNFLGTVTNQLMDIGAVQSFGNQPTPRRNPTISLF
jgi:hypothetical protein